MSAGEFQSYFIHSNILLLYQFDIGNGRRKFRFQLKVATYIGMYVQPPQNTTIYRCLNTTHL